ncbi:CoA pyrophosphatase [Geomonas sp. Red32]|uniref:NUDIX hydrolase n=1 Tax=Geomonas sp. Red32 TaxID=2912856 RepID=UPI00202CD9DB|nr:CoA pyrophosphatase [Geomonas sp. Red32]MCM0084139.1 CoA pyrophosphatase [Geomonas sp. Red32]
MGQLRQIQKALDIHPYRTIEPGERTHAAVALVLEETAKGLNLLLIERATNENDYWSGQIAFPGGRRETVDDCPQQTARRETREETGLDLGAASYLGRLSDFAPAGMKIVVSGFVYAIGHRSELTPDPEEIADAFWFPIDEIRNPARLTEVRCVFRERLRTFPAVDVGKRQPLWGISYHLLRSLEKRVTRNSNQRVSLTVPSSGQLA